MDLNKEHVAGAPHALVTPRSIVLSLAGLVYILGDTE